MMSGYTYETGVSGFDQTWGLAMRQFLPTLLRLARVAEGQRVLDVATGTGAAAEAALQAVGPRGHVTAVDKSSAMVGETQNRLGRFPNVTVELRDAEMLGYPENQFDAVLCCMGLHVFTDWRRPMLGMHRALREGGWLAASVNTTPQNSLTGSLRTLIGKHFPPRRAEIAAFHEHQFGLGDADRIRVPFEMTGFREIETAVETRRFSYPSFDAYFEPITTSNSPWGLEYAELPPDVRRVVREDLRQELERGNSGGPVEIAVTLQFAAGRK
jgi:ubiquinone/menaquinone biosynthesis C-methylase UbiE